MSVMGQGTSFAARARSGEEEVRVLPLCTPKRQPPKRQRSAGVNSPRSKSKG